MSIESAGARDRAQAGGAAVAIAERLLKGRDRSKLAPKLVASLEKVSQVTTNADPAALPTLFAAAKGGEKSVRIAAIRALPQIGDASAVPVLEALLADADGEISRAAKEGLAGFPGSKADASVKENVQQQ